MAYISSNPGRCLSSCIASARDVSRSHPEVACELNPLVERGAIDRSEYAELAEKLEAAQEAEVVEQALAAAQQHLGMDASYITTIDSRHQSIHAIVADADTAARYQGTVFPL